MLMAETGTSGSLFTSAAEFPEGHPEIPCDSDKGDYQVSLRNYDDILA